MLWLSHRLLHRRRLPLRRRHANPPGNVEQPIIHGQQADQNWRLPDDLSIEVFRRVGDSRTIFRLATLCRAFRRCAEAPIFYTDICIRARRHYIADAVVSTYIDRAIHVRSLHIEVLGEPLVVGAPAHVPPVMLPALTASFMARLGENSVFLERLVLHNLEDISEEHLFTALPLCVNLTHLEVVNCSCSTRAVSEFVGGFPLLQTLIVEGANSDDDSTADRE